MSTQVKLTTEWRHTDITTQTVPSHTQESIQAHEYMTGTYSSIHTTTHYKQIST